MTTGARGTNLQHEANPSHFLAREALLFLVLAPPLIAVLIAELPKTISLHGAPSCIAATWLATVGIGFVLHLVVNRVAAMPFARPWQQICAVAAAGTGTVVACTHVALPILALIAPHLLNDTWASVGRAVAIGVLYVAIARILSIMGDRVRHEAVRATEQERLALAARLSVLQAQTNPHFLFNSLNAVASLIAVDPKQAEATVERLASVLQYALTSGSRSKVHLRDEIAAVRDYLAIESTRFGARLAFRIDVDPAVAGLAVPPMMLQPLVENAVLHGIASQPEGGTVIVSAVQDDTSVVVTVSDDGVGPGASLRKGTQTALRGLRERLALMYGSQARFEVRERVGGGFECALRLPLEQAAALAA
jgi:two-component sensor histidine kinase